VTSASSDEHPGANALQDRWRALAAPLAKRLWRLHLEGFDRIPAEGPAILCPNHISFLDSALLMLTVPRRISFVGKAEYMDSWKTKHIFPALGMIPIDRAGGDRSQGALEAAAAVLRRGELFGIFPEGTRSRDGALYRGHTGAARLALQVRCPILPVGVIGTREIQPPDAKVPKLRMDCTIRIGRPIKVGRYQDRADDRMVLRQITDEVMFEIRELTGQDYRDVYATKKAEGIPTDTARVAHVDDVAASREPELVSAG
jgi:1-acyl-sn-glycerol-3-phosphate acyltransferase